MKLLIDNSGPGDKQVETSSRIPMSPWGAFVDAQAYITPTGQRKILLINKRDRPFEVAIEGIKGATEERVDQETHFRPAVSGTLDGDKVLLRGFAVSVITLRD